MLPTLGLEEPVGRAGILLLATGSVPGDSRCCMAAEAKEAGSA